MYATVRTLLKFKSHIFHYPSEKNIMCFFGGIISLPCFLEMHDLLLHVDL